MARLTNGGKGGARAGSPPKSLQMPAAHLEAILQGIADGVIVQDRRGELVYANEAAARELGYDSAAALLRSSLAVALARFELLGEDGLPLRLANMPGRRALRGAGGGEATVRFRQRGSGQERWAVVKAAPLLGDTGDVEFAVTLIHDITEQKRVEEQLRENEHRYRSIFENLPDAVYILDPEGRFVTVNAACAAVTGYTEDELLGMSTIDLLLPEDVDVTRTRIQHVLSGEPRRYRGAVMHKDGHRVEVQGVLLPLTANGRRVGVCGIAEDITEEVHAQRLLEQRVDERTRELATLLEVSRNLGSVLELAPLLEIVLDEIRRVADYAGAAVLLVEDDELRFVAARRPAFVSDAGVASLRLPRPGSIEAIFSGGRQPVMIPDVRGDSPLADAYRRLVGERLNTTFQYVRAWLGVPLVVGDHIIGLLTLAQTEPHYYSERHAQFAMAIANQAAVAIENARLFERAQEETRKTATLAEIAASVALSGSLETILNVLAQRVVEAINATAGAVLLLGGEPPRERMVGTYGLADGFAAAFDRATGRGARTTGWRAIREGRPIVIENTRDLVLSLPEWEPIHEYMSAVSWDTFVSVPLVARDDQLGTLAILYPAGDTPGVDRTRFLSAVADQAAVAVDNARLFAEAQGKAALEERQRLARELHDSVSQALYGIALGARTARIMLDRDPTKLVEPLDYILSLSEAGLAEMRALIFELRPESLASEGLVAALSRQSIFLQARHGIEIASEFCEEPDISLECKEACYRVAQEAVHNIIKHARARRASIRLETLAETLCLEIADDGVGFDPSADYPGHLGLRSMRERASRLGGRLEIASRPGSGATIRLELPWVVGEEDGPA